METVDLHNSHTTNLRVAVEYNAVGKAAGLPAHLCLKANWSELTINNNTDICELEFERNRQGLAAPAPDCRCFGQYVHVVIATLDNHVGPQGLDQLQRRVLVEACHYRHARPSGKQRGPVAQAVYGAVGTFA